MTRNSESQKYASLVVWMRSPEVANQIIRQEIALESDIKTVERYNVETRIQQCYKCQDYGHNTYGCKNKQRCAYCAEDHRSAECPNTKIEAKWRCGACNGKYKAFDVKYPKRRREKERVKQSARDKSPLHPVRATGSESINGSISFSGGSTTFSSILSSTPVSLGSINMTNKRKASGAIGRPTDLARAQAKIGEANKSVAHILTKRSRIAESPASSQATPASESSINTQGSGRGEAESAREVLTGATDKEIEDLSINGTI